MSLASSVLNSAVRASSVERVARVDRQAVVIHVASVRIVGPLQLNHRDCNGRRRKAFQSPAWGGWWSVTRDDAPILRLDASGGKIGLKMCGHPVDVGLTWKVRS
jgi:hypothetical protein